MSTSLAPIVLFCYNRPRHVRQTIEALKANSLAGESDLYIYSDGPKDEADGPLVEQVRSYLATVNGFKNFKIIFSQVNKGLAASVISGVTEILNQHKKIIVLEDDMLSTPDFLDFMNEALNAFELRADVFSVSGYTPPISIPKGYSQDIYLAPRASSWGWGTWLEKWQKADWQVSNFELIKKDQHSYQAFNKGGSDLWPMLRKQQLGVIDSWAIRWSYAQFKNNAYGLYPVRSKIKNIGTDGTGTNFTFKSGYYGKELNTGKLRLDNKIKPDPKLLEVFKKYYDLPLKVKIKNWIKYRI